MSLFHPLRFKLWLDASDEYCIYGSECCHCHSATYPVITDEAMLSDCQLFRSGLGGKKTQVIYLLRL